MSAYAHTRLHTRAGRTSVHMIVFSPLLYVFSARLILFHVNAANMLSADLIRPPSKTSSKTQLCVIQCKLHGAV